MNIPKIVRYIVSISNQEFSPTYNTLLGKDAFGRSIALESARATAINYRGVLVAEYTDGTQKIIKDYQR